MLTKIYNKFLKKTEDREMLSQSTVSMAFKMTGILSGYVFVIIALRYTSIDEFGAFSLSLALIQLGAIVGRLGFDLSVVKHVSIYAAKGENGMIKDVYLKGLALITAGGIIVTLVLYLTAPFIANFVFHKESLAGPFKYASFSILPTIFIFYNAGALRGIKKITFYSGLLNANFFSAIIVFVVIVNLWEIQNSLELSYAVGTTITTGLGFYLWLKYAKLSTTKKSPALSQKDLLAISLPMLSTGAITIVNGWSDTLLLGMFSTKEAVGIFQVLLKISAAISIVLFSVNSMSVPQFARLSGIEDRDKLQKFVQRSTKLIVIATVPMLVLLLIGFETIIWLMGGTFKSENYILAFAFLCVGQAFNAFCGSGGQLLNMTGHQKTNRNITFISFILCIGLNVILIPVWGIHGAAFANMSGLVVRNLLYVFYTNNLLKVNTVYNPISDISRVIQRIKII